MAKRLSVRDPVPSDIDIAQSLDPLPITEIAQSLGLDDDDFITYGPTKAKVPMWPSCGWLDGGSSAGWDLRIKLPCRPTLTHPATLPSHTCDQVKLEVLEKHRDTPNGNYGEEAWEVECWHGGLGPSSGPRQPPLQCRLL